MSQTWGAVVRLVLLFEQTNWLLIYSDRQQSKTANILHVCSINVKWLTGYENCPSIYWVNDYPDRKTWLDQWWSIARQNCWCMNKHKPFKHDWICPVFCHISRWWIAGSQNAAVRLKGTYTFSSQVGHRRCRQEKWEKNSWKLQELQKMVWSASQKLLNSELFRLIWTSCHT